MLTDEQAKAQGLPTSTAIQGLPVAGYKATQPQAAIDAVNVFKELEERTLRHIDALMNQGSVRDVMRKTLAQEAGDTSELNVDPRLLAVGRTQLQGAFMFLRRAVFQPQRVKLPGDDEITLGTAGDEHPGADAINNAKSE